MAGFAGLSISSCLLFCRFQIGQVALFMCDHYGNYLALSTDGKTYYLDGESVHGLQDLAARMPHLKLKW